MKGRKYIFAVTFVFIYLISLPTKVYAEGNNISLQDALDIAYKNSLDLRKAQLDVDKSQLERDKLAEEVYYMPGQGLVLPQVQQFMNIYQQAEIALSANKKIRDEKVKGITAQVISAYTEVIKAYNTMEQAGLVLEDMQKKAKIQRIAKGAGCISVIDYEHAVYTEDKLKAQYNLSQSQYKGALAALGTLLGQNAGWTPTISTKAVLSQYDRNALELDISRGISQSIAVYSQGAMVDIEKTKQDWIIPNLTSEMKNITLETEEIKYEQVKRLTRESIENLYYGIDSLEDQIAVAEKHSAIAQKNYEIAKLRNQLGLIPEVSILPGEDSLAAARLECENATLSLENARATLAQYKAQYAYLTGQQVYNAGDWTDETPVETANAK